MPKTANNSRVKKRKASLEMGVSGIIDYNYEFLGLNTIKDYDFVRINAGEVKKSDSEESFKKIEMNSDGNFMINL
jgi:4-hydroxy-3-methylbut-2-en-1-yl diphosphate synthase IspG/GcpE